jgi:hypothetical protein
MASARRTSVVILFWIVLPVAGAAAQDSSSEQTDETAQKVRQHWLNLSRKYAEGFTLAEIEDGAKPFQLYEKPVFLHTQSVRGDDIGAVHLWLTQDKRPAVVGAVFAWSNSKTSRMVTYELHSLVQQPISLSLSQRTQWTCPTRGFDWKAFPRGTPPPAKNTLQQRLQVKQLARQFTANTTTDKNQRWELRLVPTPIYEYQSKSSGVVHGAMFSFCQGTDTELLLLIEAFGKPEGDSKEATSLNWRYAPVPFSDYKVRAQLQEEEIWESPEGEFGEDGKPHYWDSLKQVSKPDFEITQD